MDDVEAVIEQATDAIGTPPEAPAEAPKPEVKKVEKAAKKVARKVGPKKKAGKKAKKATKKSAKKAPKKAKEGEALRSNENLRTKVTWAVGRPQRASLLQSKTALSMNKGPPTEGGLSCNKKPRLSRGFYRSQNLRDQ